MIGVLHVRHNWVMISITVRDALSGSKPFVDCCGVVLPIVVLIYFLGNRQRATQYLASRVINASVKIENAAGFPTQSISALA